jgi:hypothetical protein
MGELASRIFSLQHGLLSECYLNLETSSNVQARGTVSERIAVATPKCWLTAVSLSTDHFGTNQPMVNPTDVMRGE